MLEFGEELLDWIEIGTVGRQEKKMSAGFSDGLSGGLAFVAAEIVENDDVPFGERWDEDVLDIEREQLAVDWTIDNEGRIDAIGAQRRNEGERLPMIVRDVRLKALAARPPAAQRRHIGVHPGFVDEDEPPWIDEGLTSLPALSLASDVRTGLLGRQYGFF